VSDVPLLQDIIVLLLASLPVVFLCQKLGMPALVGFLITGIAIGPSAGGLIYSHDNVEVLADLGVALLLFTIGLEFSIGRLASMGRTIVGAGLLQLGITTAVVTSIAVSSGYDLGQALLLGYVVALSSTAVVLKVLSDRAELHAPHGQFALSVLLFQDFSVLPMLLFLPVLRDPGTVGVSTILETLAVGVLATGAIIVVARRILPAILEQVLRLRSQELLVGVVIIVCFGTAWLAESLGVSIAIGAFIAGIIVSESEYSHQVVAEILPLRDLFSSIFFVSVGMLLDLSFVLEHASEVLVLLTGIIALKVLAGTAAVLPFRGSPRVALLTGAALAQVGEFSFVIAAEARSLDVLKAGDFQGVLAAAVFSMVLAPFVSRIATALLFDRDIPGFKPGAARGAGIPPSHHVILVGYGLAGQSIARVLGETSIPHCIVDFDVDVVDRAEADGHSTIYGDATRKVVLDHVNVTNASAVVVAIRDPAATRRVVAIVRGLNVHAAVIVRTRSMSEIEELYRLGASEVVPEELETSVEMFARVLGCLDVPKNVIAAQIDVLRSEHYAMLTGGRDSGPRLDRIYELFMAATTITHLIREGSPAIGRRMDDLDLRGQTATNVIAVVRGGKAITNPSDDFEIAALDILVLVGNHAELARARGILEPADR
jgi:CPA2 family monovalent cation:H+ antiporter-2